MSADISFTTYGGSVWKCIGFKDLLYIQCEVGGLVARAENSGCEGCYVEVARWNWNYQQWQRFAFTKVFGRDGNESAFDYASKLAAAINTAGDAEYAPLVHRLPNWSDSPKIIEIDLDTLTTEPTMTTGELV